MPEQPVEGGRREAVQTPSMGVAVLGPDGTIRELSPVAARLLASSASALLGKRLVDVLPANASAVEALIASASARREAVDPRGFYVTVGPFGTDEVLAVLVEPGSQARMPDPVAVISHELRNQLTLLRASAAALRDASAGSDIGATLSAIERTASELARLIDDLVDPGHLTQSTLELVELTHIVRSCVDHHAAAFARQGIRIELAYEPGEIWMAGDPVRLAQILANVLGNAVKFSSSGGRVLVSIERASDVVMITVRDSGIGISAEAIGRVFEPFVRGPDDTTSGAGLGLWIVKQLVDLHGGRVSIRSDGVGLGTEVAIAFPIAEVQRRRAPVPVTAGRRILIIEDHEEVALSLQYALSVKGHDVRIARDGRGGLEVAEVFAPELVLCDLGLPDMDGCEVARSLRANARSRSAYLVALSGRSRSQDVARALAAGFARHVVKPPSLDDLDRLITGLPRGDR